MDEILALKNSYSSLRKVYLRKDDMVKKTQYMRLPLFVAAL